jgi:hypothetical protein
MFDHHLLKFKHIRSTLLPSHNRPGYFEKNDSGSVSAEVLMAVSLLEVRLAETNGKDKCILHYAIRILLQKL